ncbi:MAG: N-acetylmuramoyl-L-alanine amidase [Sporomusaceae bacterium]|nr:N-acetylmuramoyl-L-alanine amidase [Sporomusaceae bacterium]
MRLLFIKKRSLQLLAMLSVAVVVLNFISIRYLVKEDMENVDMSVLAGRSIIIDPGHGGIDSGASANQVVEKEITLAISAKLADVLRQYGTIVTVTRDSDIDYYTRGKGGKRNDLLKRIDIIENSGAELFISIHCNAFRAGNLSGAQVFYSPKFEQNKILAERLQQALQEFPQGNKRQAKEDLRILLLNGIHMPGVMIETGYLTNQQEAALLADQNYQQNLAEHIAKGLAYHFSHSVAK